MSNINHKDFKLPEQAEKNSFSLPGDYFSTLSSRVSEKIKGEEIRPNISLWKRVRPHIALAAAILGFALISVTALQLILGDNGSQQDYYDLAFLDEAGILEESVLQESLDYGEEDSYTEWEQDAMAYLASNEVDLDLLLNEN